MPSVSISRRGWIVIAVVVLVVGVAIWGIQAGYAPQIGRFFASEPGYVPSCAWHGEEVTPYAPQCCAGFEPIVVNMSSRLGGRVINDLSAQIAAVPPPEEEPIVCSPQIQQVSVGEPASFRVSPGIGPFFWTATDGQPSTGEGEQFSTSFDAPGTHTVVVAGPGGSSSICRVDALEPSTPTVTPTALPTETPPTPAPLRTATYCVMPGCTAELRQVRCIRAPCPPIVEFVCPSGVVPPPRPTYIPPQSISVFPSMTYDAVVPGQTYQVQLGGDFADYPVTSVELYLFTSGGEILEYVPSTDFPQVLEIAMEDVDAWRITVGIAPGESGKTHFTSLGHLNVRVLDGLQPGVHTFAVSVLMQSRATYEGSSEALSIPEARLVMDIAGATPSVTPWGDAPALNLDISRVTGSQAPGEYFTVPIVLDTGGLAVTAVKLVVEADAGAQIYMVGLNTADFPEVLADPVGIGSNRMTFSVGSGTGGGVIASNIDVGDVSILVPADAPIDSQVNVFILGESEVSAVGYPDNVLQYAGNAGFVVAASSSKPGDADDDGDVDIFDYNLVVSNFGSTGPSGDLDADGDVDIFDYNLVVSNFNK